MNKEGFGEGRKGNLREEEEQRGTVGRDRTLINSRLIFVFS